MTSPHFPTLTNSVEFAAYPLTQTDSWMPIVFETESGATELRRRWDVPVRRWTLVGKNLPTADVDKVMGFLYERGGGSGYWYWDSNVIPIWSPSDAPTTSTSAGGTIGARTYYCAYGFSDGTNTTNVSSEATQAIGANNLVTVTSLKFPTGATEARVYLGLVSGTLTFGGTISSTGGTFTEPMTTVNGDSNSGQKVLQVTATTNFESGQNVVIGEGTARDENKTIDTVQAGTSLTMTENLDYTHTAAQADEVYLDPGQGTAAPSTNTLKGIEIKLRLIGEPTAQQFATGVWNITLPVEEMLP